MKLSLNLFINGRKNKLRVVIGIFLLWYKFEEKLLEFSFSWKWSRAAFEIILFLKNNSDIFWITSFSWKKLGNFFWNFAFLEREIKTYFGNFLVLARKLGKALGNFLFSDFFLRQQFWIVLVSDSRYQRTPWPIL